MLVIIRTKRSIFSRVVAVVKRRYFSSFFLFHTSTRRRWTSSSMISRCSRRNGCSRAVAGRDLTRARSRRGSAQNRETRVTPARPRRQQSIGERPSPPPPPPPWHGPTQARATRVFVVCKQPAAVAFRLFEPFDFLSRHVQKHRPLCVPRSRTSNTFKERGGIFESEKIIVSSDRSPADFRDLHASNPLTIQRHGDGIPFLWWRFLRLNRNDSGPQTGTGRPRVAARRIRIYRHVFDRSETLP